MPLKDFLILITNISSPSVSSLILTIVYALSGNNVGFNLIMPVPNIVITPSAGACPLIVTSALAPSPLGS